LIVIILLNAFNYLYKKTFLIPIVLGGNEAIYTETRGDSKVESRLPPALYSQT